MAEPEQADLVVQGGRAGNVPPVKGRFQPGVCANPNGRRGNKPIVPIVSARDLAVPHLQSAIRTLVELLACRGKQAGVARQAARDLIDLSCPNLDEETIAAKVAETLTRMVNEAEANRAKESKP